MAEATPAQLAYFQAPASRQELFTVVLAAMETISAVTSIVTAATEEERVAAVSPLREQADKLSALLREILNEGVDPEWDYRS